MVKEKIQIILFYSTILLFTSTACNFNNKEGSKQVVATVDSDNKTVYANTDTLLLKYRSQKRPEGYDGIMMYDLLKLASTPEDKILAELRKIDKNWEINPETEKVLFENKKYNQLLQRRNVAVLFFVDYSPFHMNNVNYLKGNGYFSYDEPSRGNFDFYV